jgi:ATP-dependent RNA helicase RhlE
VSFDRLGLTPELLRAVAAEGYTEPTPVQAQAIPLVLAGRDLLANAQTGTGKTAAFVLPILQLLHDAPAPTPAVAPRPAAVDRDGRPVRDRRDRVVQARPVRVLVLAPTRELAIQVEESVRTYGKQRPVRSTAIYGGVGFDPQVRKLRDGVDVVVATPGRLLDHVRQGTIRLDRVEFLVLDEADRMLDMGFLPDIRRVLDLLPRERQSLLFSATFPEAIRTLAASLLRDPASVQVTPKNTAAELVTQVALPVDRERKRELLTHLVRSGRIYQALVFTRTKHGANRLAEQLVRDGISAAAIHGNKSQSQRVHALTAFKANKVAILVATDIAARGIDIDALPHVVNFELPMVAEDYVHRIGRTGRAGSGGEAISLVCVDESRLLRDIEVLLRDRIPTERVPGFDPDPRIRPEPVLKRGGGGGQRVAREARPLPARHTGRPAPWAHDGFAARDGRPVHDGRTAPRREGEHTAHGIPGRERHGAPVDRSERPWRPVVAIPGERLARDSRHPGRAPEHGAARGPEHGPSRGADRGPDRGPSRGPDHRRGPSHASAHGADGRRGPVRPDRSR